MSELFCAIFYCSYYNSGASEFNDNIVQCDEYGIYVWSRILLLLLSASRTCADRVLMLRATRGRCTG